MAAKTTYIPRFLLPQYGPVWLAPRRTTALTRPLNADVGRGLVRYASKTAASTTKTTTKTAATKTTAAKVTTPKAAATKVTAPKAASTKATASKATATKAPKVAPTKSTTTKASAGKPATPKTPTATTAAARAAAPKTTAQTTVPKTSPAAPQPTPAAPAPPKTSSTAPAAASSPAKPPPAIPASSPPPSAGSAPPPPPPPPASKAADPAKPLILEKPEKFNPPSHGSRLPKSVPKHYGAPLSETEIYTQKTKHYPGLPPPENSWTHKLLNSRALHLTITLGTLTALAIYTFAENFKAKSPFAHMIPPISEFPKRPFSYIRTCVEVLKMHEEHESAVTAEKRKRKVDDVAKRNEYRKAHGLETQTGFFGGRVEPPPERPADAIDQSPTAAPAQGPGIEAGFDAEGKRKKFLGIF